MLSYFTIAALAALGMIVVTLCIAGIFRQDWTDVALAIIISTCIAIGVMPSSAIASDDPQWSVSTITSSYHYDRSHDYNESHNGLMVGYGNWSVGHYTNSFDASSWLVTYHKPINTWASWTFGGATGYDGLAVQPIIGVNLHTSIFYLEITPIVAVVGITIPLGGE